ncbi:DUF2274 domain-containing protein [Pseudomonas asiatica]|nr:DUF2274 domain-containing protein [Pseudomonas asiatica]
MHAEAYGERVDALSLIPHMLEAFMVGDREGCGVATHKISAQTGAVPISRELHTD